MKPPPLLLLLLLPFLVLAKYKPASSRPKCVGVTTPPPPSSGAKLAALRGAMASAGVEAYVVPGDDQHGSEFVGDFDKRREWISEFTGSSGTAVVTAKEAVLWTDGRYVLQAEQELSCDWGVLEMTPDVWAWLGDAAPPGTVVGADPRLFSKKSWKEGAGNAAMRRRNVTLTPVTEDLIDAVWKEGRPARPKGKNVEVHSMEFAGVGWEEKVAFVRSEMDKVEADFLLTTDLMEIAWLLNLRGHDVPYNPLFYSFLALPRRSGSAPRLFVGRGRIDAAVERHLRPDCDRPFVLYFNDTSKEKRDFCPKTPVTFEEYEDFYAASEKLVKETPFKLWFSSSVNFQVFSIVPDNRRVDGVEPPIRAAKAIKNPTERSGMRAAHLRDAVALIEFVARLEREIEEGKEWTEVGVADELKKYRLKQTHSRGESFPTIAGYEANGAIVHYNPAKNAAPARLGRGMLLIDSGGQYSDGTTDVTRTFHFGEPTEFEKEAYTRVLMGHVDLALANFPDDTVTGQELQTLARAPLWRLGMEYNHGTGHGVGSYLGVHEPPGLHEDKMREGMFFSDEPGYYVPDKFGIRIENVCFAKRVRLPRAEDDRPFLGVECVTLVPYEPKLIQIEALDNRERRWINEYHRRVERVVGKELKKRGLTEAAAWLRLRTAPLPLMKQEGEGSGGARKRAAGVEDVNSFSEKLKKTTRN